MGVPQNEQIMMENPTKMDDLGVPPFQETTKSLVPVRSQLSQIVSLKQWPSKIWQNKEEKEGERAMTTPAAPSFSCNEIMFNQ